MKHMKRTQALAAAALFLLGVLALQAGEECTTAVIAGKATRDGRPLLWKNRDADDVHNRAVYIAGGIYPVVGIVSAGSTAAVWMGINSAGLAIENSASSDLEGSESGENGIFMKLVLQTCATVAAVDREGREGNPACVIIDGSSRPSAGAREDRLFFAAQAPSFRSWR